MSHFSAKSSIFFYNVEAGADLVTLWIACLKPNLGFLANLNPFLKLYDGSIYWGFLKLLKVSNQIQMGSFRSTTLFSKFIVRKKKISSSNVLHVVERLEIQKFIIWIACQKSNLGFPANLNPLLKLYAGSRDRGDLMLLKSHLFVVAVHYYLSSPYVLSVVVSVVLEFEFQHRIMIKSYIDGIFEFSKCHYSLYGISNSTLDLSPFLSNPLWVDVRISSLEKEVSDIIFINFMLITLSVYDIRVQEFSIWCTVWSYSHIGILALCLCLCLGVYLLKF